MLARTPYVDHRQVHHPKIDLQVNLALEVGLPRSANMAATFNTGL